MEYNDKSNVYIQTLSGRTVDGFLLLYQKGKNMRVIEISTFAHAFNI